MSHGPGTVTGRQCSLLTICASRTRFYTTNTTNVWRHPVFCRPLSACQQNPSCDPATFDRISKVAERLIPSYLIHDAVLGGVVLVGSISVLVLGEEKTQKWTAPVYTTGISLVVVYLVYALGSGFLEYQALTEAEKAGTPTEVVTEVAEVAADN